MVERVGMEENVKFNFDEFRKEVLECIKVVYRRLLSKYQSEHIYAFSLASTSSFDDLYFLANTVEFLDSCRKEYFLDYKYDEEEWQIWIVEDEIVKAVSKKLKDFSDTMNDRKTQEDFFERLISLYVGILKDLKNEGFFNPDILLNVYVREYIDDMDMINIYKELNNEDAVEEYKKFLIG